jgi:dolichyl-phosphate beta-glucosyltransferase
MKPYLSIIIPNYNEKKNIERGVLQEVVDYLSTAKFSWEVIVSDDEATDGSRQMIEKFVKNKKRFTLLKNRHGGKAEAIYSGLQKARGEVVLFTDMDQSTPLKEVEKLLPYYKKNYDVVFGSRGGIRKNAPILRKIMAYSFLTFRKFLLLPKVRDTQCGFKSMRIEAARQIFPNLEVIQNRDKADGWVVTAYDVELLHLSQKKGFKLKEVPVSWKDEDVSTSKSKKFTKESIDMLKQILRVKIRDLTGTYD